MNHNKINLIEYLAGQAVSQFAELEDLLDLSRYQVNKLLEEVNEELAKEKLGLQIEVKPHKGIYLQGSREDINLTLEFYSYYSDKVPDIRILETLAILFNESNSITIQELADRLYISRSTFETLLKDLRELLKKYDIKIIGNTKGIRLDATELSKRELIAKLINLYKRRLIAVNTNKNNLKLLIKTSSDVNQLLNMEILDQVTEIVSDFIDYSNLLLTEYEFSSLVIHISIALERLTKKFTVDDYRLDHTIEENTQLLIQLLEENFDLEIPDYEQNYINIHIMLIQQNIYNSNRSSNNEWVSLKEEDHQIDLILKEYFSENQVEADWELMNDLTLHLRTAIKRLENKISIRNPYVVDIKEKFAYAFELSLGLAEKLEVNYAIDFDEGEISYIAIHIQSFLERQKDKEVTDVVLVCGSGYGTAKLLAQRLMNAFGESLNIVGTIGLNDLNKVYAQDALVITTVPIDDLDREVIYVNPLLTKHDIESIAEVMEEASGSEHAFSKLLADDLFFISNKEDTQATVIENLVQKAIDLNYAQEGMVESVKQREALSSTALGLIAMPHGAIDYVKKSMIGLWINPQGIEWEPGVRVKLVFLFLINQELKDGLDEIYQFFNQLIDSEAMIQALASVQSLQEFKQLLRKVR